MKNIWQQYENTYGKCFYYYENWAIKHLSVFIYLYEPSHRPAPVLAAFLLRIVAQMTKWHHLWHISCLRPGVGFKCLIYGYFNCSIHKYCSWQMVLGIACGRCQDALWGLLGDKSLSMRGSQLSVGKCASWFLLLESGRQYWRIYQIAERNIQTEVILYDILPVRRPWQNICIF